MPKVTKYHEQKVLPSLHALVLHCKRANYVLKLTLSAPWAVSPFLPCFEQFGWHNQENSVQITWDADQIHTSEEQDLEPASDDSDSSLSDC